MEQSGKKNPPRFTGREINSPSRGGSPRIWICMWRGKKNTWPFFGKYNLPFHLHARNFIFISRAKMGKTDGGGKLPTCDLPHRKKERSISRMSGRDPKLTPTTTPSKPLDLCRRYGKWWGVCEVSHVQRRDWVGGWKEGDKCKKKNEEEETREAKTKLYF